MSEEKGVYRGGRQGNAQDTQRRLNEIALDDIDYESMRYNYDDDNDLEF